MLSGLVTEYTGPFDGPVDVVSGPDGNLWALNNGRQGNSSIAVIAPGGAVEATYPIPTPNASAQAMAVGPDGNVWFVETQAGKIGKVTPGGQITEYPVPPVLEDLHLGTGPVEVAAAPTDVVAGPDGALWFTESSTGSIGRATTDGVITDIATPGLQPTSLAVGPDGAIWFTSTTYQASVARLNADGTVSNFPLATPGSRPADLIDGPDGALWFVENLNGAVGRITTQGVITETSVRAEMASPQAIAFDVSGNPWVTGDGAGLVRVNPGGGPTTDVDVRPASPTGFFGAIARGPGGALWFTDPDRNLVGRVDPADVHDPTPPSAGPLTGSAQGQSSTWFADGLHAIGDLATVRDADTFASASDLSARIDWGDGQTSVGTVYALGPGTYRIGGDHLYTRPGAFAVTVTVADVNPLHVPTSDVLTLSDPVTLSAPTVTSPPRNPAPVVATGGGTGPVSPPAGPATPPTPPAHWPLNLGQILTLFRQALARVRVSLVRHVVVSVPALHRPAFHAPAIGRGQPSLSHHARP
jgi:virginiamycin B lyase